MKKKILIAVGVVIGLFVAAAIIVPLVVDVDKYRPRIVEMVNQKINGRFELGKLKLSLWGHVRVDIAGLTITGPNGRKMVSVRDAHFNLPFWPLLTGSPVVTLQMDRPDVNVIKERNGKLNIMSLMKESSAGAGEANRSAAPAPSTPAAKPAPQGSKEVAIPGIAARARLGLELQQAQVTYSDQATGLETRINDLNLRLKDLSLNHPTELELWADLDTKMGKSLTVKGKATLSGEASPRVSGGKLESLSAKLKADLDGLDIDMPGTFHKSKGMAANLEGSVQTSADQARIEKVVVRFFNAEISADGTIDHLSAPVVNVSLKSNEIDLKPWTDLLPSLEGIKGIAFFDANATGPANKLGYKANLVVKDLSVKAPMLKAEPVMNLTAKVITDQLENLNFTMKAPGNDLRLSGRVVSFAHPKADFELTSSGMDLDQLVDFQKGKAGQAERTTAPDKKVATRPGSGAAGSAGGNPPADLDALLNPLRSNPVTASMVANIGVDLKFLQAYGARMTDIRSKMTMRELTAAIESLTFGLWDGKVAMNASVAMKPKTPTYKFGASLSGLKLEQAVQSQLQMFKNTIVGTADFKMDGTGSSFNTDPAKRNLNARGSMHIANAKFATIDVMKMATEAVNKGVAQAAQKVPALRGKELHAGGGNRESQYEMISSDFTIAGGRFSAPDFNGKAKPNQGIDIQGNTQLGLIDYALNADWTLIDTYNLTHARDLGAPIAGVQRDHILAEGNGPVKFPVHVGCNAMAPCYSYAQVPEYFAKVVAKNLAGAAGERVQQKLLHNAPAPAQKALQGLGKKLFGR